MLMHYAFVAFFSLCPFLLASQNTTIAGEIPFSHTNTTQWHERFAVEINRYKEENKALKDKSCDVLFLGSSTISFWKTLHQDFAPLNIIRRSYGGATLRDMFYNYRTIARGFSPKKIVLYVENDLSGSAQSLSAVKCFDLFRLFIARLRKDHPTASLLVVALKPSPSRRSEQENRFLVNNLLRINAKEQGYTFIDINPIMHTPSGKLRSDIFIKDSLHLNSRGYELWKQVLTPYVMYP